MKIAVLVGIIVILGILLVHPKQSTDIVKTIVNGIDSLLSIGHN